MNFFQPRFINWSYLKRGIVHRIHMNTNKKITILVNKASKPNTAATLGDSIFSSKKGISYPPKNKQAITALLIIIFTYSAKR